MKSIYITPNNSIVRKLQKKLRLIDMDT